MNMRNIAIAILFCLVLCVALGVFTGQAKAQTKGADKDLAAKKGIADSLGHKEWDQKKLPGKLQIGLALGSLVAMIAVLKWL